MVYSKTPLLFLFFFNQLSSEEQLIYSVVLVSDVQQSGSVIHIYFQILLHYRLLQDVECSSPCHTVGPCHWSALYMVVCICSSQAPNVSFTTPGGNHKFVFYVCSYFVNRFICIIFLDYSCKWYYIIFIFPTLLF